MFLVDNNCNFILCCCTFFKFSFDNIIVVLLLITNTVNYPIIYSFILGILSVMLLYSSILRIHMKQTSENRTNSMQGNYFNKTLQELDEVIENVFNGEKLKW